LLLLALAAPASQAESLYVIGQIIVAVSSDPAGGGEHVATIRSGDQVELLERQSDQVHIRLANGREGWVKASYLSPEEPPQLRLNARTAEVEKLKQDVGRLESELAAARAAANTRGAPQTPAAQITERGADPPRPSHVVHDAPFFSSPDQATGPMQASSSARSWTMLLGSSALALCVGFALGWRTLDRHIRRKYGGLRIY
jgi:Bacterial SH3 domain